MLHIIIGEGPRCTGKSTTLRLLRNAMDGSTLVNATGFKDNHEEGFKKIQLYYDSWFQYLDALHQSEHSYTIIFDRFFFSEMIYSTLYKTYDFEPTYHQLCERLLEISDQLSIYLFSFTNHQTIEKRLNRDKAKLFDQYRDELDAIIQQKHHYVQLFLQFMNRYKEKIIQKGVSFYTLDVSRYTSEQLKDLILRSECGGKTL